MFNPPVYHQEPQQCPFFAYKSREDCASLKTECRQANSFDPKCGLAGGLCCFDGCTYKCYDGNSSLTTSFYQSSMADSLNDNTVSKIYFKESGKSKRN